MMWNGVIKRIVNENGEVELIHPEARAVIEIPVKFLPDGCRVGDVIRLEISFAPYETLNHLKKA